MDADKTVAPMLTPFYGRWWFVAALVLVFVGLSVPAILLIPGQLIDNWVGDRVSAQDARLLLGNAAQIVLFSLGGFIAVVGVSLTYLRHVLEREQGQRDADRSRLEREREQSRVTELTDERRSEQERELRARFIAAVQLLSDDTHSVTRQAGIYALAALADDWNEYGREDERQVCIDVLCGYLRTAWDPEGAKAQDERQTRSAAFSVIAGHLRDGAENRWDECSFDLTGAQIDYGADLSRISLTSKKFHMDFSDAKIGRTASIGFDSSELHKGLIVFRRAVISGQVSFAHATLSGVSIVFDHAMVAEHSHLNFNIAILAAGRISFRMAHVVEGQISFYAVDLDGGKIDFGRAVLISGAISFEGLQLEGGDLRFVETVFAGSKVQFNDATFASGAVVLKDLKTMGKNANLPTMDGEPFAGFDGTRGRDRTTLLEEQPMTDSTAPDGTPQDPNSPEVAAETQPDDERTVDPTRTGDHIPGLTTSAAPLTDSTDGGLDGGDPGVEE